MDRLRVVLTVNRPGSAHNVSGARARVMHAIVAGYSRPPRADPRARCVPLQSEITFLHDVVLHRAPHPTSVRLVRETLPQWHTCQLNCAQNLFLGTHFLTPVTTDGASALMACARRPPRRWG